METAIGDGNPEDTTLLLLALFNNIGHLYSNYFCMIPETRHCAHWMRSILSSWPCQRYQRRGGDLNFFFLSVAVMPELAFTYAPGA